MKMNRPAAWEIILSNINRSGQGNFGDRREATLLNRYSAKIRKSEVVSLSAVKLHRKCDNWVELSTSKEMNIYF